MASSKYYSNCSIPLTTGCFLYTDIGLTTPAADGFYSQGIACYTVTGGNGEITAVSSCPTTTTTVVGQSINILLSDGTGTPCLTNSPFNNVYILPSATFGPGTVIYYDSACTDPMDDTNSYIYVSLNTPFATVYEWYGTTGTIGSATGLCMA